MAGPATAVIDASVAAKWFLAEPGSDAAIELRRRHLEGEIRLVAPDLLPYELANALRYHPGIGAERWADRIEDLFAMDIAFDPTSEQSMHSAIEVAYRQGLSVNDAAYVALAQRLDTVLYSADESLLRAAGARGESLRSVRRPG